MDLPMTAIIATRTMLRNRPDGTQTTLTVNIGAPAPTPAGSVLQGWYCPLQFQGFPALEDCAWSGSGSDSAEALISALIIPGKLLRLLSYAREINFSGLPTFGFPESLPLPNLGLPVPTSAAL